MQLVVHQIELLRRVEAMDSVLGTFLAMSELDPMIHDGFIEKSPVPRQKGQLVVTEAGKAGHRPPCSYNARTGLCAQRLWPSE